MRVTFLLMIGAAPRLLCRAVLWFFFFFFFFLGMMDASRRLIWNSVMITVEYLPNAAPHLVGVDVVHACSLLIYK